METSRLRPLMFALQNNKKRRKQNNNICSKNTNIQQLNGFCYSLTDFSPLYVHLQGE